MAWGLTWRTALALVFIPLLAAFIGRILTYMLDGMVLGLDSTPDDILYNSIQWASQPANLTLVGIAAVVMTYVAGMVVEGRMGV